MNQILDDMIIFYVNSFSLGNFLTSPNNNINLVGITISFFMSALHFCCRYDFFKMKKKIIELVQSYSIFPFYNGKQCVQSVTFNISFLFAVGVTVLMLLAVWIQLVF